MDLQDLAKRVSAALMAKQLTMCTVEECTSGLVGATISTQDHARGWYKGSITVQDKKEAIEVLGVMPTTINKCGFTSYNVAQQMALTGLSLFNADIALCVIGEVNKNSGEVGTAKICVAKQTRDATNFKYTQVAINRDKISENMEAVIDEALRATLEQIMGM